MSETWLLFYVRNVDFSVGASTFIKVNSLRTRFLFKINTFSARAVRMFNAGGHLSFFFHKTLISTIIVYLAIASLYAVSRYKRSGTK